MANGIGEGFQLPVGRPQSFLALTQVFLCLFSIRDVFVGTENANHLAFAIGQGDLVGVYPYLLTTCLEL